MRNLDFVNQETRAKIMEFLEDDGVHFFAKDIVRIGLEKDCVDAYYDAQAAADMLKMVLNNIFPMEREVSK